MNSITRSPTNGREVSVHGLRRAVVGVALLLCLVFGVAGVASATQEYSSARKLGRGFSNLGLGVLALPREVYHTAHASGPFMGATWGVVRGVGFTAARELVGVWEIVTVPFQMPRGWKPLIDPEFPWQGFAVEER